MIKNYIATRVFVMVDAVMGSLFLIGLIIGFHILLAYAVAVTLIWCTVAIPLAWLGVLSVYHRLKLVSRKHEHEQYLYEQRTLMQLDYERQNYQSPPPNLAIDEENSAPVALPSHQSQSRVAQPSGVASSQSVASGTTVDNCNVAVAYYLSDHPGASIRDVERGTGYPKRTIGRTLAWQNR